MSDPILGAIFTQLFTIMDQQIRREVRLVSGAKKDVKKLESTFKSIKAVLVDAENRQVKEEAVKVWLENLIDVSYDTEDVLSEWITAMQRPQIEGLEKGPTRKVCSFINFSCLCFKKVALRRDIALKIEGINERLDIIANEKDRYNFDVRIEEPDRLLTTSFVDVSEVRGRDGDKDKIIGKLLSDINRDQALTIVSILGLGGMGKTTLAQVVYNASGVVQHFEARIWVCVSEPFDEVRIAKAIVEDIEGNAPYLFELETLLRRIREYISGKRFLLVLDDVWTEDFRKWEQFLNSLGTGAAGSTILVTTRNERVAKAMGSSYEHSLGQLSELDSWSLFSKIAFFERRKEECEMLEDFGKRIAEKCKGLPLTLKTIGSLMRFKKTLKDWEDVWRSEFWELKEAGEGLFPPLMLSYQHLPALMKRCFLFCAIFPKDHVIDAKNLIKLWMAQGYLISSENVDMEEIGQQYLENLTMRSFFQDLVKDRDGTRILSLKLHDMVHDFAHYLMKNECFVTEVDINLERKLESSPKKPPRHLTLVRSEDTPFPTSIPRIEKLRTFWVQSFYDSPPIISQLDKIDPDFFKRLPFTRALDLSRNRIGELPDQMDKMVNVKYLNLSHNPFWELPPTLCDLFNLQTLKLNGCVHLRKLPQSIGKLLNLRHLEIEHTESLKTLPKGISKMTSLHTLSKFVVVQGNKTHDSSTCGLGDLENLNHLEGCLKIEGLGYVTDANEAKRAELHKKRHLSDLHLDFTYNQNHGNIEDEVIESLEPHENLQSLEITSYKGINLPKWITKLTKLQKLFIKDCKNLSSLPPLGRLPSLITLHIEGLDCIKSIGPEFLGLDSDNNPNEETTAFPKLKKLKFSKMESWEEWDVIGRSRGNSDGNSKIMFMPRLKCLKIAHCNNVKEIPSIVLQNDQISKLRMDNCKILKKQYQKKTGEKWNMISHISKVRIS